MNKSDGEKTEKEKLDKTPL